jgi:hypothetical protein
LTDAEQVLTGAGAGRETATGGGGAALAIGVGGDVAAELGAGCGDADAAGVIAAAETGTAEAWAVLVVRCAVEEPFVPWLLATATVQTPMSTSTPPMPSQRINGGRLRDVAGAAGRCTATHC